jgi:hypothetical protein
MQVKAARKTLDDENPNFHKMILSWPNRCYDSCLGDPKVILKT